jgi:hypothetical protein
MVAETLVGQTDLKGQVEAQVIFELVSRSLRELL